jgi:phosphoesterase RecJ-like protein
MVNHKIEAQAIKNAIAVANSILLVAHRKPDADTLGSVCAWISVLESLGKQPEAFCYDSVPDYLRHLYGSYLIKQDPTVFDKQFDLIIVNDSGDLEYAGIDTIMAKRDNTKTTIINVDHHATNPDFGNINLVVRNASSTTEVLSRLFIYWEIEFEKPLADCLLHGLVTDTDKMTNPATSYHSLAIISKLVEAGADLYDTIRRTLYTKSIIDLKLWGLIMSRLKHSPEYKSIATYVTDADIDALGASVESIQGVSNYLSLIPSVNIILFLHARADGDIKGSLRTVQDNVDVAQLAGVLGGGGHKKASGFKLAGSLQTNGANWTII